MTSITHPAVEQLRRAALRDLVRRTAAALAAFAHRLHTKLIHVATAGQLGPVPEIEVGRWTGARV